MAYTKDELMQLEYDDRKVNPPEEPRKSHGTINLTDLAYDVIANKHGKTLGENVAWIRDEYGADISVAVHSKVFAILEGPDHDDAR